MNDLEKRVAHLENLLKFFIKADRYRFPRDIELPDGVNIRLSASQTESAGSKIGTAANQKLGFFGVTPVAQQPAPFFPTHITIAGTGDDADLNTNFNRIESAFDDTYAIIRLMGFSL